MDIRFLATKMALVGSLLTGQVICQANAQDAQMLIAKEIPSAEQIAAHAIRSALQVHDYTLLGVILRQNLANENISLNSILHIAKYEHSEKLLHAVESTIAYQPLAATLGVDVSNYIQAALFIEANLEAYIQRKQYFLVHVDIGLPVSIEYDPKTQKTFILFSNHGFLLPLTPGIPNASNFALNYGLDSGWYMAIEYHVKSPQIVARGEEQGTSAHEIHKLEQFQKSPGVVHMIAHTSHEFAGQKFTAIYLPFYDPGSLWGVFDGNIPLSMKENASIALHLLHGLHEMHKKKVVHRSLGSRNYLVNIPAGTPGNRTILSAITDLEHALKLSQVDGDKVQVNPSYVAPEGIFHGKLHGRDYFRTDVYAMGLVFYQLYFGKPAPWQSPTWVTHKKKKAEVRYKKLKHEIEEHTDSKRKILQAKKAAGTITPQESFELLILKMVHADPEKRGSAKELYEEMKVIFANMPTS